jgi:D-3-phosphoglycerate dehydrogenase
VTPPASTGAASTLILHVEPDRCPESCRALLDALGTVDYEHCADSDALVELIVRKPYEAVFLRLGVALDQRAIDAAPSLRWAVTPTTGLDHIDLDAARDRGIDVVSLRGHTEMLDTVAATAELTWALLLALVRRLPAAHASVLDGRWEREQFVGTELRGRTLGIIGCGRLGRMTASYGLAFGMKVLVHDIEAAHLELAPHGAVATELDRLLADSDVVCLHLPLDPSTVGYLDTARLAGMKPGAFLVNTARGELWDEAAVLERLRSGALAGLATDVVGTDSRWPGRVPADQTLVEFARLHDNVVITPHIGGYARDAIATTRLYVTKLFADRVQSA